MNQWYRSLIRLFTNMNLRRKLLISYFILIFLPLALMTTISYKSVSKNYEKQILHSADLSFDQAYTFLNYKLNTLIQASDVIFFNNDVQTILKRERETYEGDVIQQNMDRQRLEHFLNNFKNKEDVYRASIYVPDWFMYSDQNYNFLNIHSFAETEVHETLMTSKEMVIWLPPHMINNNDSSFGPVRVISLLRKIRNHEQSSDIIGIIKLNILQENIEQIIQKANITNDGVVYIQNSSGVILSKSNKINFERINPQPNLFTDVSTEPITWKTMKISDQQFIVKARAITNTDWTMITVIPLLEIYSQSIQIRNLMLILMFVCGLISYGLAFIITGATIKRIILLKRRMKAVQEGDLNVGEQSPIHDEIGHLTNSFNHMIKRIKLLVDEQYQNGKEIKNLELKALQAQINPHFLYNTLELINWKAIDNEVPEIATISQSLAKFYKLSLNKGKDFVSIKDEINHIKEYVNIQNLRFDDKIHLVIDIEPNLYSYEILKLVLQPIVENSIIHGILEKRNEEGGSITIIARQEHNDIVLTVQDDGVGIPSEKVNELLTSRDSKDAIRGYSVKNINHRIGLCYGLEYGLKYHSATGNGTVVEIRIPAIRHSPLEKVQEE